MVTNHQMPNILTRPRLMARSAITMEKLLENRQIELKIGTSSTSRGVGPLTLLPA